jgi:hypothetical protein
MNNDLIKLLGTCCIWLGACVVVAFSILGLSIGYSSDRYQSAAAPGFLGALAGTIVGSYAYIALNKMISGKSGNG